METAAGTYDQEPWRWDIERHWAQSSTDKLQYRDIKLLGHVEIKYMLGTQNELRDVFRVLSM